MENSLCWCDAHLTFDLSYVFYGAIQPLFVRRYGGRHIGVIDDDGRQMMCLSKADDLTKAFLPVSPLRSPSPASPVDVDLKESEFLPGCGRECLHPCLIFSLPIWLARQGWNRFDVTNDDIRKRLLIFAHDGGSALRNILDRTVVRVVSGVVAAVVKRFIHRNDVNPAACGGDLLRYLSCTGRVIVALDAMP